MKKMKNLIMGLAALCCVMMFAQCAGNQNSQTTSEPVAQGSASGFKVAYVEIDSLLSKYNFCIDLNEAMVKKSENVRLQLNQKAQDLQKQQNEFQTKLQNNAFLSEERARQEYNRINKLSEDLQTLSDKLQSELAAESEKNNLQLSDSIKNFLKEYNKTKGFSLIISNTGMDNLLLADEALNITQEVLDGLNARYSK
ncbi:MAG: OmpH family outer membrane protein [Bacteroidaceae bacterium]|nr:OmpH family outer membrane protein [Bacteroidaceae bacterium]